MRKLHLIATTLIGLSLLAISGALYAASLEDISYTSLPGDRVQLKLKLSEPVGAEPLSFTIDNPARIALDFPGTELNLAKKNQVIGVGNAESVTAIEADGRTRVVLNLVQLVPYSIGSNGDTVTVTLDGLQADLESQSSSAAAMTLAGDAAGANIRDIDFRRGAEGEAQILVDLSDPNVGINIREQGKNIIVDFIETGLPDELDRKLDVMDFATPAREIDTFPHGNGTRMVVAPVGLYEHLAYQSENTFTLEIKPLTKEEEEQLKREKFGYTGERLSLNFQDIEVRAVLQLIADFTEFNLVASDSVSGSVTLRLKNVPWDQAMDIILKTKGLGMRQEGNVIMVAPQEEIATREKLELEAQQQLKELAPLRTEFVQINYAKAGELADLIKADSNNLLSDRGNVTVDQRTNTLLIQDTANNLSEIREVVEALDIAVRQVLIESRIVVANEDFSKDLGVQFGYSHADNVKDRLPRGDGTEAGLSSSIGGGIPGNTNYGTNTTFNTDGLENYIVGLPVAGPAAAFNWSIGRIGSYLLQLELSALQAEGRGEIVASPRVITANQKEAVIESGQEIPYQEATSSGATSVSFKKAVLSLKVTPQITPDDRIIMDLAVNRDAVGQVFAGVPSIDTNEVNTQVLVENGDTVVLGGIYESTNRDDTTSVPFFGELPYLGRLFRRTEVEQSKQELLIFVTPKILKEDLTVSAR
ncbi:MAG: type IV pilus secretin PilQ [Gammaproteobacteria bacterium]